jgi:hypothetical protein
MKKRLFTAMALVLLAIVLPLTVAHAFESFLGETETRLYKPAKSYNGYFMPVTHIGSTVYLMDMLGNVVHTWNAKGGVSQISPDGTLWSLGNIQDWDSNVLWDFDPTRDAPTQPAFTLHHDARRIWNKKLNQWTMLIDCNRPMTQAEAVAYGLDPGVTYGSRLNAIDFVIEVNMAKQIVWAWYPWNHGCQSKNPAWPNYVSDVKLAPGRTDVNWFTDDQRPAGQTGIANNWFVTNAIDYNEDLDQVVINQKTWSQFVVVDHGKTFVSTTDFAKNIAAAAGPDGDFIYRWGCPASYNAGKSPGFRTEGDNQMYGPHNIQWIRPYHWERPHLSTDKWPDPAMLYGTKSVALPGAGHFMIFDNGCYNPTGYRSRVIEINGFINAAGTDPGTSVYVDPVVAGYKTTNVAYHQSRQVVSLYSSTGLNSFYSPAQSGCQRLPNGNTSINAAGHGHMFEVTASGEVVWEYLYPVPSGLTIYRTVASDGPLAWQVDTDQTKGSLYAYRHYRYGADYPGLAGKDLTPKGTLTGRLPRLVGSTDSYPPTVLYTGFGYAPGGSSSGGGGAAAAGGGGSGY